MAKRKLKEKEIIEHLEAEGFKEVRQNEKNAKGYKRASKKPECLTTKALKHCVHTMTKT